MSARPLIGVTTSRGRGRALWWFVRLALRRAGAATRRYLAGDAADGAPLDGLVVGGGDDIAATLYGGELDPAVRVDPERDRLELQLLEQAMRRGLPVLGICRGAQMLNVFLGGTLHEDIYAVYEEAPRQRTVLPKKTIRVTPGSQLAGILECERCRVNALHHQSVDRLGEGLAVSARDQYEMVQGIESGAHPFVLGVQWHPEFLVFQRGQQRLFRRLVAAAGGRRAPGVAA